MLPLDSTNDTCYSFVIFGASGNLALTKIFPALWLLYRDNRLPQGTKIFTFSRTRLHTISFRHTCVPHMSLNRQRDPPKFHSFWTNVHCMGGDYTQLQDYAILNEAIARHEDKYEVGHRIFHLAVPPVVFNAVTTNISRKCMSSNGATRIILEKPFARHDNSYRAYQTQICQTFKESQIYMNDHNMSKRVVNSMLAIRFANRIFSETWNCQNISAIMISVKSEHPVVDRADYFDRFGIIRDIMTNHMMQLLALLAIEQPYSSAVDDLRDEKMKVLKDVLTVTFADVVLGQYVNNMEETDPLKVGYQEHPNIRNDSVTPTFALIVLKINNKRWTGVPFILRAGRALHETKTEIRIQYKPVGCDLFEGQSKRNELVLRLYPQSDVFMRVMLKSPDELLCVQESSIPVTLKESRLGATSNFQSRLLDVFNGNQTLFMRTDEQCEIWRIFSPVLSHIQTEKIKPLPYPLGSRGPMAAYRRASWNGFEFHQTDQWHESKDTISVTQEKCP